MNDGTSQRDRAVSAFQEGYFNVDELSFEALLAMAADYSQTLNFFNLEDEPAGDWEPFFTSDEAVIIALILTTDLGRIESAFLRDIQGAISRFGPAYNLDDLSNYQLATRLNFWFARLQLNESRAGAGLEKRIAEAIEGSLRDELLSLGAFFRQYDINVEDKLQGDFDRFWLAPSIGDLSRYPVPAPTSGLDAIERFLARNFHSFYNTVSSLKTLAANLLPDSLTSGTHKPATGLYLGFLKLFQKAQEQVNRFTRRHLSFYYDDVLQVRRNPPVPDSAYLILSPDVADREVLVREGVEFTAGVDEDNQYVIYTADNDLLVHGARVESLYTLHFERDPLSSPEHELDFASGAKTNRIPVPGAAGPAESDRLTAWPLLGAARSGADESLLEDAEFGFALASPVLFLKEGDRRLEFTFNLEFQDSLLEDADPAELAWTPNLDYFLERLAELLQDSSPQDAFFKAFRQMFTIYLTAENGWHRIPEYLPLSQVVDAQCEKGVLKIQFRLSPDVPPVTGYSPEVHGEVHGGHYDTELPLARFVINPAAYLYPYSLMKNVVIRGIAIAVSVQGARELVLANNLGPLDPANPFNPFGPIPSAGSYLVIGSGETARKQVTRFDVSVEWGDLPTTGRDFADYYRAYGMPFDNSLFEARVTALRDGRWLPGDETEQQRVKLFQPGGGEPEATVAPSTDWRDIKNNRLSLGDTAIQYYSPAAPVPAGEELVYSSLSKNGFFKLALSRPVYAFGHKEYPLKLTETLTANARLRKPELFAPVPNPPYTPLINVISLDYEAVATFNLEQAASFNGSQGEERIFHLHPFGLESISTENYRNLSLLPRYDGEGNLFIGLSPRSLTGMLTLFFHLREDCSPEAGEESSGLTWHYLASNRWRQLERSRVISDTTNGFLSSGIVTLDLPGDINRDSTIMPGDLFWLRLSASNHPDALCSLYSVHAQALKVSWQTRQGSLDRLRQRLPAGTIKEPRVSIPGVGNINQIVASFGGSPPETTDRLTTRISERLRHKNRAVSPWDYERLVLERFPEIFKVKCFPGMVAESGQERIPRPGHVSLVVIPDPKELPAVHLKPMVNGLTLREIQEFVARHASPFAAIQVRNPAYEQIQIRCTVKFKPGIGEGYYILALNQAITDYISPWSDTGGYGAQFGWRIRRHDIETFIRSLDYVDFVTNFSMLRISDDDQDYFRLFDTVSGDAEVDEIDPRYPWSIAIPARRHFIETTERFLPIPPEATGIDELEIGSTFIIRE